MCGIAGFCSKQNDRQGLIQKMCDQIVHRGPDAQGFWSDDNTGVTLGHRRLAILDLSENGAQPMISHSGRFVMAYNGEIYNYQEIAKDLICRGKVDKFRGTSDTEVLLEAFETDGLDAIKKAKGMFAIALFDRQERTLYLMRDRMGEKPLYYGFVGGIFAFASDLASLQVMDSFHNEIDRDALDALIRYKSIPQPLTIFEQIYKLIPGQILKLREPYQEPEFLTYWSLREVATKGQTNKFTGTIQEAEEELKRLLKNAVCGQMIADVPVGAFLSGGIDSPLVVSVMQSLSNQQVKTFTIGFEEQDYNEAEYAKDIATYLGTEHTELYVSEKELKDTIPLLPTIFSEPIADPACLPNYLVSKLAKKSVTVTLSGDGGDELFCGYGLYQQLVKREKKINQIPYSIRNLIGKAIQVSPGKKNSSFYTLGEYAQIRNIQELHNLFRCEHDYIAYHLVNREEKNKDYLSARGLMNNKNMIPAVEEWRSGNDQTSLDSIREMLYQDQTGYLTDTILNKVDRTGMAVSLENRIPLLDKDIIEFSWSLPTEFLSDGSVDKKILKQLLYQYVPQEMLDRPKHGFEVPLTKWLSNDLKDWADDSVRNSQLVSDGYLDRENINRLWDIFTQKQKHTLLLWYVIQAEQWYRKCKSKT